MANFQTFDYGQVLSQGEAIKNARLQNQMLQQEQDPNSIRNQLLREQLSGARQGNVLAQKQEERSATQYGQQQEIERLKLLNAASAQVSADPTAINYWGPKLKEAGALPPDYDYSKETPEAIMKGAQTIYESTSKALGLATPKNNLISVAPETTLFNQETGQPVYTAPAKQQPPQTMTPGEAARLAQAERFHKEQMQKTATPAPMSQQQRFKMGQTVAEDYKEATGVLDQIEEMKRAIDAVSYAPGLKRATGVMGMFPSVPNSPASLAEGKLADLEGKLTEFGKASASMGGAIGQIANQEWQIMRNMVASIDPAKGDKHVLEQLDMLEARMERTGKKVKTMFENQYGDYAEQFPKFSKVTPTQEYRRQIPPLPSDRSARNIGRKYKLGDGRIVKWDGKGLVEVK